MRRTLATLSALAVAACGGGGGSSTPVGVSTAATSAQPAPPPPSAAPLAVPPEIRAAVDAADRDPKDRELDAGRKPAELLAFAGIRPGMKVAELGAGGGYTTELLARAVGAEGVVYGQNTPFILERFADEPWAARLAKDVNRKVVKVTREFDDPLPPEASELDAVLCVLFYHDTFWMKVDRAKMNAAVFRALKPGGVFVVVDHSGRKGSGASEVQTLHRIEQDVVQAEITAAGFRADGEGAFLRNPEDARDWNAAPSAAAERRGTSDRFVMRFVKP